MTQLNLAESHCTALVVLVVVVAVAILEVLNTDVVGVVLRDVVLSTSPGRIFHRETAPDLPAWAGGFCGAPGGGGEASGTTRFKIRTAVTALAMTERAGSLHSIAHRLQGR